MKRVTASQARKDWFGLLDEVAAGETVVILRHGRRIILRREAVARASSKRAPDYRKLLRVAEPDQADRWGWVWEGPGEELVSSPRPRRKR